MSQLELTHGSVKAMFEDDLMKIFCSDPWVNSSLAMTNFLVNVI